MKTRLSDTILYKQKRKLHTAGFIRVCNVWIKQIQRSCNYKL